MSRTGCVLEVESYLCEWDESLSEVSRVSRPPEEDAQTVKYQLPDGRWALHYFIDCPTYLLSADMASVVGEHSGDYGFLSGVINGALLYAKKVDGDMWTLVGDWGAEWKLSLYSATDHTHLATLPQTYGGDNVSVCGHPSGQFAIIDQDGRTLDVYTSPTSPPRRVQLDYEPWWINAVTSVRDVIIVADDSIGLHMYDWCGRQLGGRVDLRDMGVREEEIRAIGGVGEDRLMVAAGGGEDITALYVYSVDYRLRGSRTCVVL